MNAAVKTLSYPTVSLSALRSELFTKAHMALCGLLLMVFVSALGVIYLKDVNRRLLGDLLTQQQLTDDYHVEWGKLLLEQSTLAAPSRVQSIAHNRLGMRYPKLGSTMIVMS